MKNKEMCIGFYNSSSDIGNHEVNKKIGEFGNVSVPARLTFLSDEGVATIIDREEVILAEEGMILGQNALLKTNGVSAEIKIASDTVRIRGKSEFCIESTIEGVQPVFYGNVYYKASSTGEKCWHKYRTSCWVGKADVIIERLGTNADIYYALSDELVIYEYDEKGNIFEITKLNPYEKCTLEFNYSVPLRDRYIVKNKSGLSSEEVQKLYKNYLANENWNKGLVEVQTGIAM